MFESTLSKRFLVFAILFILAMLCTLAYAEEPDPTPTADAVAFPADGEITPSEEPGGETPAEEIPETPAEEEFCSCPPVRSNCSKGVFRCLTFSPN